jgi:S-adenosylmethionine:tRNA ribosyltransferase-isomerase
MLNPRNLRISDFSYHLPNERIAQHPLAIRDGSRLLQYQAGNITHHQFTDLPSVLPEHTLLLFNNTRVVQARLLFRKETGALVELFCLEPLLPTSEVQMAMQATQHAEWLCLVGNNKRWKSGPVTMLHEQLKLTAERLESVGDAFRIRFSWEPAELSFAEILLAFGEIPLPPYLKRKVQAEDNRRYQTVYARFDGAVAAPTAGLHFTERIFDALLQNQIGRQELTLHVGAGTFKPVKSATMEGHDMHREEIVVTRALITRLLAAHGPIVPVGTTSLRTLESLYWMGEMMGNSLPTRLPEPGQFTAYDHPGELPARQALDKLLQWFDARNLTEVITYTSLMIAPGYKFRLAKGLITNFHQPESTLLLLVSAAIGENWRQVYDTALAHEYRFLSYGDSSLLWFEKTSCI